MNEHRELWDEIFSLRAEIRSLKKQIEELSIKLDSDERV